MITSLTQAVRIQRSRWNANKPGYAKAVARFIKRTNHSFDNFPCPVLRCSTDVAQRIAEIKEADPHWHECLGRDGYPLSYPDAHLIRG